jgi:hypothetical protein
LQGYSAARVASDVEGSVSPGAAAPFVDEYAARLLGPKRRSRMSPPAAAISRARAVLGGGRVDHDLSACGRYDRCVERAVHDRGGLPTEVPIDRSEHELADWELLTDALVGALGCRGLMNVDELRRGIESMPLDEYERASYYERWLFSVEALLTEKGVLAAGELDARLGR